MKDIVINALNRPFATVMIVGSVGSAIAAVINAVKGTSQPMVSITSVEPSGN